MAHFPQKKFVEEVRTRFPAFFERSKVLEVGSWNVTGTIRDVFNSCDYRGVELSSSPDPALAGKIASLWRAVRQIKLNKPVTPVRTLSAHGEWWLKWSLSRLVGEPAYHNFRHFVRPRSVPPKLPPGSST